MPLELIDFHRHKRILCPGDQGFLIKAKTRYQKTLPYQALRWLNRYKQRYFEYKCPEEAAALKKADRGTEEEETTNGEEGDQAKEETEEVAEENSEEKKEETQAEEPQAKDVDHSGILFAERELVYEACSFIATNLADPADYLHFVFTQLAENCATEKKTKYPIRCMPVSAVCEAKPRALENVVFPLVEKSLGGDLPHRFSLNFNYKKVPTESEHLSQKEAAVIVRNCIWATNPNCVQCIKFQDFAIVMDQLDPLFLIGIAKDFNRLGGYVTSGVRHGFNLQDQQTDSEDDISDDPTLEEEDNKRRKLRIKRKRRAAKAGLTQYNGDVKKTQEEEGEGEEGGNEDEQGEEMEAEEEGDEGNGGEEENE